MKPLGNAFKVPTADLVERDINPVWFDSDAASHPRGDERVPSAQHRVPPTHGSRKKPGIKRLPQAFLPSNVAPSPWLGLLFGLLKSLGCVGKILSRYKGDIISCQIPSPPADVASRAVTLQSRARGDLPVAGSGRRVSP